MTPQIAVLMTGDGAGYDDGVGFHADMAQMHAAGWGIEVVSWLKSCRNTLRNWATANGVFIPLDDYYGSVTFLEGGRRSTAIELSSRGLSVPRLGPAQQARLAAKAESQGELLALRQELEALRAKSHQKLGVEARYQKRRGERQSNDSVTRQGEVQKVRGKPTLIRLASGRAGDVLLAAGGVVVVCPQASRPRACVARNAEPH